MLRRHSVAHLLSASPGGWHLKRECHGILISPQERMSTFCSTRVPDAALSTGIEKCAAIRKRIVLS